MGTSSGRSGRFRGDFYKTVTKGKWLVVTELITASFQVSNLHENYIEDFYTVARRYEFYLRVAKQLLVFT